MAVLEVLSYPDPRLRVKATPVTQFNNVLKQTIQDLYDTMYEDEGCGLAATQVGVNLRIFVMDLSGNGTEPRCLINPEILECNGERIKEEGCLSFPGVYAKVARPQSVLIRYCDENGQTHEETFTGLGAACCQHETQHLDGILYVDLLSPIKRTFLVKKLKKYQKVAL